MRTIVSVSVGSSSRDHEVEAELLGETFRIRRVGTDGDMRKARDILTALDGTVTLAIGATVTIAGDRLRPVPVAEEPHAIE